MESFAALSKIIQIVVDERAFTAIMPRSLETRCVRARPRKYIQARRAVHWLMFDCIMVGLLVEKVSGLFSDRLFSEKASENKPDTFSSKTLFNNVIR